MIISMAWTSKAFLLGRKTVTRRFWSDDYAKRFHKGDIVDVYNKSPRNGGKKIGQLRITVKPYKEMLRDMPDEHFEREGGTMYWPNKYIFIEAMGVDFEVPWVIEFERKQDNERNGA